jgi:hypothetical protein
MYIYVTPSFYTHLECLPLSIHPLSLYNNIYIYVLTPLSPWMSPAAPGLECPAHSSRNSPNGFNKYVGIVIEGLMYIIVYREGV